jgi:O-antigen ligase
VHRRLECLPVLSNIKALVVITFLAMVVFHFAKPVALRFMEEADFRLRRNMWFGLSAMAFLSPSFWLFALVAAPIAWWAGRKDSNPAALLVLIGSALPSGETQIPKLITVGPGSVLLFFILIPALLRRLKAAPRGTPREPEPSRALFRFCMFLILVYCVLLATPFLAFESWTNVLRREANLLLGAPIGYLFFSKLRSHQAIREVLAAYVLSAAVLALIGVAEAAKGWLLYIGLGQYWGIVQGSAYVMRAGQLRAMASTGHFLWLGFMLAMAFACWLYLKRWIPSRATFLAVALLLWAGMMATYARGAWIAAILMLFVYYWLQPGGLGKVFKVLMFSGLTGAVVLATPWGDRIVNALPFTGTVDRFNVEYRQRLLQRSLELIPDHPWFGDIRVIERMQDMRQGEGIVDLVNGYLNIALQYGLVTLGALVLLYLLILWRTRAASHLLRDRDEDASALGVILMTCIIGDLFFAYGAAFPGEGIMLAGLATSYVQISRASARSPRAVARPSRPSAAASPRG